jgi:hypothetical protein
MNLPKLKGILREKEKTYSQCAEAIGKSIVSFNSKMNGKVAFTIPEMEDLGNFLGMTDDEKIDIFLH